MRYSGFAAPLFLLISACSGLNTFDRGDAAELIEAAIIDPEKKVPVSSWDISQCLIEEGYINTFMRATFEVEDRGREYFSSWDHNLFSETGYYAFAKPVGFADVTVTGIGPAPTQQEGEVKLVEFEARYDFKTVFGENAVPDCLTNLPIVKGTATATKFDDGWRIAFTRLPVLEAQGLPEASNASQEPAAKADGQQGDVARTGPQEITKVGDGSWDQEGKTRAAGLEQAPVQAQVAMPTPAYGQAAVTTYSIAELVVEKKAEKESRLQIYREINLTTNESETIPMTLVTSVRVRVRTVNITKEGDKRVWVCTTVVDPSKLGFAVEIPVVSGRRTNWLEMQISKDSRQRLLDNGTAQITVKFWQKVAKTNECP